MHKFLRAVGFSQYKKKQEIDDLLVLLAKKSQATKSITVDKETNVCEKVYEVAPGLGISIFGDVAKNRRFRPEYYYPFLYGSEATSDAECTVQRHAEKETYAGLLDEYRVGISLIFYLQNSVEYREYLENEKKAPKIDSAMLSGLSVSGKILLPLYKTTKQIERAKVATRDRNNLIEAAKNGDEDAMESLTIEDIDLYSQISRRMLREDVYSIIDTCFMPCGIECDQYSLVGEIKEVEKKINQMTEEVLYLMQIECNDLTFPVCINKKDLLGEPTVGRRFKGKIWMQGKVNFKAM